MSQSILLRPIVPSAVVANAGSVAYTAGSQLRGMRHSMTTTPGQLRIALMGLWLLLLIFAWASSVMIERHRLEMKSIGKDSAPSIIAAQSIKLNIAQLHGEVIRSFLGTPAQATDAIKRIAILRPQVSAGLLAAAENITYGDDERNPIRDLLNGLSEYDNSVARALALKPHGPDEYLPPLRDATSILDKKLCPATDALDKANQHALTAAYTQDQSAAGWSTALLVICAILTLTGLVGVQVMIRRRTHRHFSIPLVATTLLALIWTVSAVASMRAETADLKVAKEDAFDSIGAMCRARSAIFNAQSHLALSLLDPQSAQSAREVFASDTAALAHFSEGESFASVKTVIDNATGSDIGFRPGSFPRGFAGYLASELNNLTFAGERDATVNLFQQYVIYLQIAGKVQETEHAGMHALAAGMCLGDDRGNGDARGALIAVDSAMSQVLSINQREFDQAVDRGFGDLAGMEYWNYALTIAGALLVYRGVEKRVAEYNR